MTLVYIALGTNLGNRLENLATTVNHLSTLSSVVKISSCIQTKAAYVTNQPDFLNQVVCVKTDLDPYRLLAELIKIEHKMGRMPSYKNGPRLIDLDILFYGQQIINSDTLQVPHPLLYDRPFVLKPLYEIAPHLICPKTHQSVSNLMYKFR